jgi:hypothetical protein
MASRGSIKASIRRLLGTESDDPAYDDDVLNPVVQEAVDSLLADINIQNAGYFSTTVTLSADSSTSRTYTFATQAPAITNFARWLEVRWTDPDGLVLDEVRYDELRAAGADHFTLTGTDDAPTLETSKDSTAGMAVWLRYTKWADLLTDDNSVPAGIPLRFHDLIALEAIFAFELGGEQGVPAGLHRRWMDRRGQLMHHVGKRGVQPSRTRIYADQFD